MKIHLFMNLPTVRGWGHSIYGWQDPPVECNIPLSGESMRQRHSHRYYTTLYGHQDPHRTGLTIHGLREADIIQRRHSPAFHDGQPFVGSARS